MADAAKSEQDRMKPRGCIARKVSEPKSDQQKTMQQWVYFSPSRGLVISDGSTCAHRKGSYIHVGLWHHDTDAPEMFESRVAFRRQAFNNGVLACLGTRPKPLGCASGTGLDLLESFPSDFR
jgi:hypothetical protein